MKKKIDIEATKKKNKKKKLKEEIKGLEKQ